MWKCVCRVWKGPREFVWMTKQSLHLPKYFPAKTVLMGTVGGTIRKQQQVFDPQRPHWSHAIEQSWWESNLKQMWTRNTSSKQVLSLGAGGGRWRESFMSIQLILNADLQGGGYVLGTLLTSTLQLGKISSHSLGKHSSLSQKYIYWLCWNITERS